MVLIAPSLLSADFSNLQVELKRLAEGNADIVHLDIMDGNFVPNLTFGAPVVKMLRRHSELIFDVHMMVEHPENYISSFADAGANMISFHYEATAHVDRLVQQIKSHHIKAGVVLNPATPVDVLKDILPELDYVLLMSVNPGFGGQKFIPYVLNKVCRLKSMIEQQSLNTLIEVDGGVNIENAPDLIHAGADILVAGSAVFNADSIKETIKLLRVEMV